LLEALHLGVNGIVLKDSVPEKVLECLVSVQAGRRWIEQDLMQKAFQLTMGGTLVEDPLTGITKRERAVAELAAQGVRNRDIAVELGMTEGTVKMYLHRIYEKLQVSNRTELSVITKGR
jgi:two-component system nitrate/nitrite response regulator NarP